MSQCPVCQSPVPDDFGLIECKKCGAALFVEFDGAVTAQNESEDVSIEASLADHNTHSQSKTVDITDELFGSEDSATVVQAYAEQEPVEAPLQETLEETVAVNEGGFEFMPQSVVAPESHATSDEHMDELKDFANSALSQGREGLLRVNMVISGIDTADLRNSVYEALLDKKFLWDAEGMIKGIHAGRLQIEDLPSVKAVVLLSRLKSIPVNVSWEQHAIHQA